MEKTRNMLVNCSCTLTGAEVWCHCLILPPPSLSLSLSLSLSGKSRNWPPVSSHILFHCACGLSVWSALASHFQLLSFSLIFGAFLSLFGTFPRLISEVEEPLIPNTQIKNNNSLLTFPKPSRLHMYMYVFICVPQRDFP